MGLGLVGCGTSATQGADGHGADTLTSSGTRAEASPEAQADASSLVAGNTAFALDLFQAERMTSENAGKNLVFSPYGASIALAMTYAGAGGATESQMAGALRFALPQERLRPAFNALDLEVTSSEGATVTVANSLWPFSIVKDRVIPGYLGLVSRYYGASVISPPEDVEEARQAINAWVSEATGGRVTEVLPPGSLPQDFTAMVLVDAISFSGLWTFSFPPGNTQEGPFHLTDGKTVAVQLMSHDMDFGYAEDESWQVVELPYGPEGTLEWGDYSMVCLLPKDSGLDEALEGLTAEGLESLLAGLSSEELVYVTMPRFKFDSGLRLKETCQALGMSDAFDPDRADFSAMYTGGAPSGIWIDDVYQTATISVDEKGTEAAAGSAVVQVGGIGPNEIVLDHPFLFFVRHRPTGAILFMGQVMNPAPEAESLPLSDVATTTAAVEPSTSQASSSTTPFAEGASGYRADGIPTPIVEGWYSYRGEGRFVTESGREFFWRDGHFVNPDGTPMEVPASVNEQLRAHKLPPIEHQPNHDGWQ
jgi:serpin B